MPEEFVQNRWPQRKSEITHRSKDILRALMDPAKPGTVPWSSSDLQAILNHQLSTPLACEMDHFAEIAQCSREEVSSIIDSCGCRTFRDLLQDRTPPDRALRMVKDFAKTSLTNGGDIPLDVARVLYVTAILRGRNAGISDITSLDEANLQREAWHCLTFGWLPDDIRELLRGCMKNKR